MSIENIPGQERAKRFLRQIRRTGQIPHALLLSGMAGIGKTALALEFAKWLNCLEPHHGDCCDTCPSCLKMTGGYHPDLIRVRSDGAFIKLDQVRRLRESLRFQPFEGKWRIMVLEDAHKLREEAGNALLKLLEEPPKQNLFVLLALEPQMLLPTIVSRCCHVRLQPLEEGLIEKHLKNVCAVPSHRAKEVARLAGGSLSRALWLVEEDRIAHWQEILQKVQKLETLSMLDFFALVYQWIQESPDLEQDMECITLWVRDMLLARLLTDYQPLFSLDEKVLRRLPGVSVESLFRLYDHAEEAVQQIRQNANKQLALEGVCLAIKEGFYGQGHWDSISKKR
jgi:DNA polymerase-3 subunit delta'